MGYRKSLMTLWLKGKEGSVQFVDCGFDAALRPLDAPG